MTGTEIMFGIGLGLTAIGTGVAISGQSSSGAAEANKANYEADMLRNNAAIEEQEAENIEDRTEYDLALHKRNLARTIGTQKSLLADSGIVLGIDGDSSMDLLEDTVFTASLDEQLIRHDGAMDAYNTRVGANNTRAQSDLTRWGGKVAKSSATTSAIGSGLTGMSSMAMGSASFFKK